VLAYVTAPVSGLPRPLRSIPHPQHGPHPAYTQAVVLAACKRILEAGTPRVLVNNAGINMFSNAKAAISKSTGRSEQEAYAAPASMNAMGRVIQPEEVVALCLFLASDAAASITGTAYNIDGGEAGGLGKVRSSEPRSWARPRPRTLPSRGGVFLPL
jgi:hypothetical protein